MQATISVPTMFPMKTGEILKIKNSNGKGLYATYKVGLLLSESRGGRTYNAECRLVGRKCG